MAKEQSEKNCYPSRYSPGGWVRSDQYIIELICEKKARHDNKDLPIQFWKEKEWAAFFRSQLRKCKSLLNSYSSEAIIKGLQDKRSWKIYSLYAPWLLDIIDEYQTEISRPKIKEELPEMSSGTFTRKKNNKKNILDILGEIE
jgi:hypothetical protein